MTERKRRITSTDVARASGVSRATVSYVLNDDPRQSIPPETRERVLTAARALGYQPFAPARILRAGYSTLVLAVVQFEQVDPYLARDLQALEATLAARGFTLIVSFGGHMATGPLHPSANLSPAVVIAFVNGADPAIAAFLQQFNVPVLSMNTTVSRRAVGRAQVAHLVQHGKQHLVFAAPERQDVQWLAEEHLAGVREGCIEFGLEPPVVQVIPASRDDARAAIAQLLTQQAFPFGICCYNDEVAFAVLAALVDQGMAIPETVAVIGCDDIPLAQFSTPPLTSITFQTQAFFDVLIDNTIAASRGEPTQAAPKPSLSVRVRASV